MFYLLTGKATYQGDTLMKKILAHREQPIPSIRAIRPEVPEDVQMVFSKMVAKNVEDRYQTMIEVIADLESLMKGQAPSNNASVPSSSFGDSGLTNFLNDISLADANLYQRKRPAGPSFGNGRGQLLLIGGGVLGVLFLLGSRAI